MSFLKKIQKVLALLSPWGPTKPARKSRLKNRNNKRVHPPARKRRPSLKLKAAVSKVKIGKKASPKVALKKIKKTVPAKKNAPQKKPTPQKKITVQGKPRPVKTAKKTALKPAKLKRVLVGEVTHYFDRVKVGAFMVTGAPIVLGDALEFEGKSGVFRQEIKSLQINRVPVKSARAGDEVGILVKKPVREGDYVFKVL